MIENYLETQEDELYLCEYLEKKLFAIASLKENFKDDKPVHIRKVCLQNFRGFKGKAELDLQDSMGNAASFVLIYAPNGCGKTSIFDGIEYALKGKVDYAFRCFLLRLGFIGDEYKAARRVLLKNLTGNGAWKNK